MMCLFACACGAYCNLVSQSMCTHAPTQRLPLAAWLKRKLVCLLEVSVTGYTCVRSELVCELVCTSSWLAVHFLTCSKHSRHRRICNPCFLHSLPGQIKSRVVCYSPGLWSISRLCFCTHGKVHNRSIYSKPGMSNLGALGVHPTVAYGNLAYKKNLGHRILLFIC